MRDLAGEAANRAQDLQDYKIQEHQRRLGPVDASLGRLRRYCAVVDELACEFAQAAINRGMKKNAHLGWGRFLGKRGWYPHCRANTPFSSLVVFADNTWTGLNPPKYADGFTSMVVIESSWDFYTMDEKQWTRFLKSDENLGRVELVEFKLDPPSEWDVKRAEDDFVS